MKHFEFINSIMGNSKHSVVSRKGDVLHSNGINFPAAQRSSDSYADVQLGRLRSIDHRLGKVLLHGEDLEDGLFLDNLKSATSFLFLRKCEKPHGGFGFYCDITFRHEISDVKFVIQQMAKPKRKFQGQEDRPLDVFDISPGVRRQILGLIPTKRFREDIKADIVEGAQVFCVKGLLGLIEIKDDWTNGYEVKNSDGETVLIAQRFNRLSGGYEFQIYSLGQSDLGVVVATLVRLEEAKFVLKVYSSCTPTIKALLISCRTGLFSISYEEIRRILRGEIVSLDKEIQNVVENHKIQRTIAFTDFNYLYHEKVAVQEMDSCKKDNKPTGGLLVGATPTIPGLDKLDVLNSASLLIIQRKSTVDYFTGKIWYEIMDAQKNVIFKASKPKMFLRKGRVCKVSIRNLKDSKLLSVVVESTSTALEKQTQAVLYMHPDTRIGYIEKHGGLFGAPCYEIFNTSGATTFIVDSTQKTESDFSSALEYEVRPTKGSPVVAKIMMRTGLNYVLNADSRMPCLEKATLLGTILAMDLLKPKPSGASGNQYQLS